MTIRELDHMTDDNTLELVWDDDLNATALTGGAEPIRIGPAVNLPPHQLFALAASSSLMTSFLNLAAATGVPVQGYVSSARVREGAGGEPELALTPRVVVGVGLPTGGVMSGSSTGSGSGGGVGTGTGTGIGPGRGPGFGPGSGGGTGGGVYRPAGPYPARA